MTQTWTVSGLTCSHCVASVTEEVSELPGVRSVDLVLGVLATLKSGGTFVLLDPCDPPQQLQRLVDFSAAAVVVAAPAVARSINAPGGVIVDFAARGDDSKALLPAAVHRTDRPRQPASPSHVPAVSHNQ